MNIIKNTNRKIKPLQTHCNMLSGILIYHEKSSINKRKDFQKSIHETTEPENRCINAYVLIFILPHRYALGSLFVAATAQVSALYPTNSPLAEYPPAFVYTPAN